MKRASIDLGTNTCLLLIEEFTDAGSKILHDESNVVRLGQGVAESGQLSPDAMARASECLLNYAAILKSHGVVISDVIAVGTAQARDAGNAKSFFETIHQSTGIHFKVLTGDEEAKATFLGAALPDLSPDQMVVMDIGGGSTELVAIPTGSSSIFGESLNMGAVKLSERFFKSDPVTDDEFWACEAAIDRELEKMLPWRETLLKKMGQEPELVAVAGTAVTLAMVQEGMMKYDRTQIDGVRLTQGDAHRLVEEFKWRTIEERKLMPGMEAKRADVILAGALIFWRAMEVLSFKKVRVSTRGLRYGIFKL